MLAHDRPRIIEGVTERLMARYESMPQALETALFDTIYEERRRLDGERDRKAAASQNRFYDHVYQEARHAPPLKQRKLLEEVVRCFVEEVAGHFDPRIYALATRAVPKALNLLLNATSPLRLLAAASTGFSNLEEQLDLRGDVDSLSQAARRGTTILVPTHLSNLDSIVIGYALHRMGLPPFIYGAGLNLFHNKLIGFFMHNLGAYRVDRRKKAALYKEVLKTYAGLSLEMGYHNLFFPGGTRSRSGGVERKLKLGLLGMGLDAYIRNLRQHSSKPDIFVVPCTLNYQLVLEAETLIDDHLKEQGKARYIIEDDEFSEPRRIYDFVQKLLSLNSRLQVVISTPLDLFGNRVDDQGISHDSRGRTVDRMRYVLKDGIPVFDPQRDACYTHELAGAIAHAYQRDTVIYSTHLLCYALFKLLRAKNPELDLYRLLRTGGTVESFGTVETYAQIERLVEHLRGLAAQRALRLDSSLATHDTPTLVGEALAHLASYHQRPAVVRRGDRLFHEDRNLLLYYHNRLDSLGLVEQEAWL